jgi:hypothetical protein
MFILKLIGWIIVALLIAVIVVYIIGLCKRAAYAIKAGIGPTTKELLSPWDNLYAGSIGLFKKSD